MSIITPSYLQNDSDSYSNTVNNNHSLKIGQVIDVIFPEGGGVLENGQPDPKQPPLPPFPLYTVLVSEKVGDTLVSIPFSNCILRDMFGSVPDFLEYSLRKSNYSINSSSTSNRINVPGVTGSLKSLGANNSPSGNGLLGANVVIECINGSTFNAIILGAVRTYNQCGYGQTYTPVNAHTGNYLNFAFNGITAQINDDGELNLQRIGPTDDNGSILDKNFLGVEYPKNNTGTLININKAGDLNISTGTNDTDKDGNNNNFTPNILLEKTGKITISSGQGDASQEQGSPTNSVVIDTDGSITVTIQAGTNLKLQGHQDDATLTLGSGMYPVAIATMLKNLYNQLSFQIASAFDGHVHTVASFGPSGPPTPFASMSLPNWDPTIESASTKVPK
jgi:hypothetical protein